MSQILPSAPDPKPGKGEKRTVDRAATKHATLQNRECVACGRPGANGHHVLPKDKGGDDVPENLVTLCGSGTAGCHGAHHGNPYTVTLPGKAKVSQRRDAEWVNRRIGEHLTGSRWDAIDYAVKKLGQAKGRAFLKRTYYITGV